MLHVYHSNRLEVLYELLLNQLASPLADPFASERVLVANPGIARWLNLRFADSHGIAANIDYPMPASFVWQLYRDHLDRVPERSGFAKPRMLWQLFGLFDALDDPCYAPLRRYLDDPLPALAALKRGQLASNIADTFDQYLVYRPDWLADWERGGHAGTVAGHWQPALWRALVERIDEPHRGTLQRAFCARAADGQLNKERLPARLSVFNTVALPPGVLDVLCALAEHTELTLYALNPSATFWDDVVTPRQRLRARARGDDYADTGNAFLAICGRLGQASLRLLHARGEWVNNQSFHIDGARDDRLGRLQADILALEESTDHRPSDDDRSITVHSCHSPLREVQVLHDALQSMFSRMAGLEPSDVIVMVPQIDTYAPLIGAVFESVPPDRQIPYAIADRSLAASDPLVAALRALLALPDSDFSASAVLDWLALPALARRFGLADPDAQRVAEAVVTEAGARRLAGQGPLAADQAPPLHSWAFALRRQLAAWLMPDESGPLGSIYPGIAPDREGALTLGRIVDALEALLRCQQRLVDNRSPAQWFEALNALIDTLLEPDEADLEPISAVIEVMRALAENATAAGAIEPVPREAMLGLLDDALAAAGGREQRFLTGRVTFSSLVPLRSVPFRVVCVLGLNDGEFPRDRRPPAMDLMPSAPRDGDRSVRDDDHYLFLEAILSARETLWLSRVGRTATDNSPRAPSVLLAELVDYHRRSGAPLVEIEHPLQAFSPRAFDPSDPDRQSFAREWIDHKSTPQTPHSPPSAEPAMPAVSPDTVDLAALITFWCAPSEWYCRRTAQLALHRHQTRVPDHEPFSLNKLEEYHVRKLLLGTDHNDRDAFARAMGEGLLPHGPFATLTLNDIAPSVAEIAQKREALGATRLEPATFEIELDADITLVGALDELARRPEGVGLLRVMPSKLRADKTIAMAIAHQAGCAAGFITTDSHLIGHESDRTLAPIERETARQTLRWLCEKMVLGTRQPLPFFPISASEPDPKKRLNAWRGHGFSGGAGECEDDAVMLLWPGIDDPADIEGFNDLAETWRAIEGFGAP